MTQTFTSRLRLATPLVVLAFATSIAYLININLNKGQSFTNLGQLILLLTVLGMALFVVYFISKLPKVIIDQQTIRIGSRYISFTDIAEIELYSSVKFSMFANTEISTIKLKNGDVIRFYIENYSNGNLIRLNLHNLQQYLAGKTDQFIVATKNTPEANYNIVEEDFTVYRHTALKVILYWVFFPFILIFAFLGFRGTGSLAGQIVVFGFSAGMFLMCVLQSRYFIVSRNFLVIKNYLMPSWSKTLHLSDIDHIRTFISLRGPSALNIVTSSFKHYRYPSGFLSLKMYNELVTHIQENKEALTPEPETIANSI